VHVLESLIWLDIGILAMHGLHGQYACRGRQCVGVDVCAALYLFVSSLSYDVENGVEILGEKTGSI
jgi:hypothetical protein